MNRRQMLKYTAWLTGAAVSAPFATAFLSGCSNSGRNRISSDLLFFEPEEFELVSQLADIILPKTDSPSATDVNVHYTIDSMIGLVFEDEFKNNFKNQLAELITYLDSHNFLQLENPSQEKILSKLELSRENRPTAARLAFTEIKQQTIAYYLTTEEIGTNYLNYLPIPGEYKPCISVDDVNNTKWAI